MSGAKVPMVRPEKMEDLLRTMRGLADDFLGAQRAKFEDPGL